LILYSNLGFLLFSFIPLLLFLEFKKLLPDYLKPLALVAKGLFYVIIFVTWVLQCITGNFAAAGRCPNDDKELHVLALGIEGFLMAFVSIFVITGSYFAVSCDPAMVFFQMIPGVVTAVVITLLILWIIGTLFFLCFKCCQRAVSRT
jgi:hypothetical protein